MRSMLLQLGCMAVAAATLAGPMSLPSLAGCSANGSEERQARQFRELMSDFHDDQVEVVIAAWYTALQKGPAGELERLTGPHAILETCECLPPGSTPPTKPVWRFRNELAYNALKFSYEIEDMRRDDSFARVAVWERGGFYAHASGKTYEQDAQTTFVLERGEDGQWQVLAYAARPSAVPEKYADDPMPDLRDAYFLRFPR